MGPKNFRRASRATFNVIKKFVPPWFFGFIRPWPFPKIKVIATSTTYIIISVFFLSIKPYVISISKIPYIHSHIKIWYLVSLVMKKMWITYNKNSALLDFTAWMTNARIHTEVKMWLFIESNSFSSDSLCPSWILQRLMKSLINGAFLWLNIYRIFQFLLWF